jgi:serine/threonine protein kinase
MYQMARSLPRWRLWDGQGTPSCRPCSAHPPGARCYTPAPVSAVELQPGTILSGTYEIVRRIGAGGMGAVYEARHLRLQHRRVAIKVLLRELAGDAEAFARFRREAEIGARLGHPHIINVTDWDQLPDGSPFMVMDFLSGEDLASRLERGPIPYGEGVRILREVGSALAAAHRHGIIHRDLKPQNVFLVPVEGASGEVTHVKVLDFGISKIADSRTVLTQETAVLGTPQYMAPEQALGKLSDIDPRTDQFALAAMAYELLTGQPAFEAETLTAALFKVVYTEPRPLKELAPALPSHAIAAIERGMAKKREERFADVMTFVQALSGELDFTHLGRPGTPTIPVGKPVAIGDRPGQVPMGTPGASLPAATPSAPQRHGPLWIGLGLAGALAIGGLAFVFGRSQPPPLPPRSLPAVQPPAVALPPAPPSTGTLPPPPNPSPGNPVPPVAPPPDPQPGPPAPDATPPKPAIATPDKPNKSATSHPARSNELPEVAAKLDEAEQLFHAGRYLDAVRRAQQSQPLQKTPRAGRIILRSYCAMKDIGGARSALYGVAPKERAELVRECRQLGVDLVDL